jgi:hypothetical protein
MTSTKLRRKSATARLLESRVQISLMAWMFVSVGCVGSGLCDGLITCSEEFYRECVYVSNYVYVETSKMGQARHDLGRCTTEKKNGQTRSLRRYDWI